MKPLAGINVLDFSQFLSGPSAALRLADLGANVTKIENPAGAIFAAACIFQNGKLMGRARCFTPLTEIKKYYRRS
ncbi:hypothetical protein SODG_005554 [Sodalis praecaptivus]